MRATLNSSVEGSAGEAAGKAQPLPKKAADLPFGGFQVK